MTIIARRYHDISCGHRVVGHENKCRGLHGHNYRVTFHCEAEKLDSLGRVIDFGVIKSKLCMWLEDNWDHKTLLWLDDPLLRPLKALARAHVEIDAALDSVIEVAFNPTAENMAEYLLTFVGPLRLEDTGVRLIQVDVEETRKCSATATII